MNAKERDGFKCAGVKNQAESLGGWAVAHTATGGVCEAPCASGEDFIRMIN